MFPRRSPGVPKPLTVSSRRYQGGYIDRSSWPEKCTNLNTLKEELNAGPKRLSAHDDLIFYLVDGHLSDSAASPSDPSHVTSVVKDLALGNYMSLLEYSAIASPR